jgi:hypothetical protein
VRRELHNSSANWKFSVRHWATLRHLKQPAEPVGPLTLRHEHSVGRTVLFDERHDLLQYLIAAGPNGVTAEEAALAIIGRSSDSDKKTIKRHLAKLVDQSLATKQSGKRTSHGAEPDRWYASPQAAWGRNNTP